MQAELREEAEFTIADLLSFPKDQKIIVDGIIPLDILKAETLAEDELRVETVSLEGLKPRTDYSLRLRIEVMFLDEKTCHLLFKDVGFGEFFPASDFQVEKVIHLGGSNGQFNSMS